ncbi:hypothetical protein OUZ56_005954 [Daphnia magna]|uniref:Secreted protein n=1 Tax=Daphnia magna TaxID=35525 RepID=A0ABQ9YU78_9CRUS|nr:hypothetical protein OUZ56_005954 [Daphnia magna]
MALACRHPSIRPLFSFGYLIRASVNMHYLVPQTEMSHPLLGQRCDRGEEIIRRSPLLNCRKKCDCSASSVAKGRRF